MIIYFIGMPGCGKTFNGKKFAELTDTPFLDLDEWIEKSEKRSISTIFEVEGEAYFRQLEKEKIAALSFLDDDLIVSCGGGTPCFFDNMEKMRQSGIIVYLKASVPQLLAHLETHNDRPLLTQDREEKLLELLEKRKNIYQQADFTLPVDKIDLNWLHKKLRNQLKNKS